MCNDFRSNLRSTADLCEKSVSGTYISPLECLLDKESAIILHQFLSHVIKVKTKSSKMLSVFVTFIKAGHLKKVAISMMSSWLDLECNSSPAN